VRTRGTRPIPKFEKKAIYTHEEIAVILGVSRRTVIGHIRDGSLYGVRLAPGSYRIPLAGFLQFLGEPPRIKRVTRKLGRRLPRWARELDGEEEHS
jgi:excisionase family DNA binding protein